MHRILIEYFKYGEVSKLDYLKQNLYRKNKDNTFTLLDIRNIFINGWIYEKKSRSAPSSPNKAKIVDNNKNLKEILHSYQEKLLEYEEELKSIKLDKEMEYVYMENLIYNLSEQFNEQKREFEEKLRNKNEAILKYRDMIEEYSEVYPKTAEINSNYEESEYDLPLQMPKFKQEDLKRNSFYQSISSNMMEKYNNSLDQHASYSCKQEQE